MSLGVLLLIGCLGIASAVVFGTLAYAADRHDRRACDDNDSGFGCCVNHGDHRIHRNASGETWTRT